MAMAILRVLCLMILAMCIYCEIRSYDITRELAIDALCNVIIGPYGSFSAGWTVLIVLSVFFRPIKNLVGTLIVLALVLWFVLYLKNMPQRIKNGKVAKVIRWIIEAMKH